VSYVPGVALCSFCGHSAHAVGTRCGFLSGKKKCKCKGKQGFWSSVFGGLGNAIGEAMFGGER
jgi:hypothetical protein